MKSIKPLGRMPDPELNGVLERRDWGLSYFDVVVYGGVYVTGCPSKELAQAFFSRYWYLINP